jgi:hypothetical protein
MKNVFAYPVLQEMTVLEVKQPILTYPFLLPVLMDSIKWPEPTIVINVLHNAELVHHNQSA